MEGRSKPQFEHFAPARRSSLMTMSVRTGPLRNAHPEEKSYTTIRTLPAGRIRSEMSARCASSRKRPSKRSPSSSPRNGDGDRGVGRDAAHRGGRPEVFELQATPPDPERAVVRRLHSTAGGGGGGREQGRGVVRFERERPAQTPGEVSQSPRRGVRHRGSGRRGCGGRRSGRPSPPRGSCPRARSRGAGSRRGGSAPTR